MDLVKLGHYFATRVARYSIDALRYQASLPRYVIRLYHFHKRPLSFNNITHVGGGFNSRFLQTSEQIITLICRHGKQESAGSLGIK